MDFNVTSYKKLTDVISDSTVQLTFKKPVFIRFQYSIKEEYPQISEKTMKICLYFSTTYLCKVRFSSCISTKQHIVINQMQKQTQEFSSLLLRIQLSSINQTLERLVKNVKQCHSSYWFTYSYFSLKSM